MVELIIVTGMSGAGKSVALKSLEDMGYFGIDNVPYVLGSMILRGIVSKELDESRIALGVDTRSFEDPENFHKFLLEIKDKNLRCKILFLDAEDRVILNRYNLSRRKHPVKCATLIGSIERERKILAEIRGKSDYIVDTSYLRPVKLKEQLMENIVVEEYKSLTVHFQSFGFKYGTPVDLDMMFDVRCLPNPYYIEGLRVKTGNDKDVREYVMDSNTSKGYYKKISDMLKFLIPQFIEEGKSHLSIGVGCSGGKHRSVTFINKLTKEFEGDSRVNTTKSHVEEERGNWH